MHRYTHTYTQEMHTRTRTHTHTHTHTHRSCDYFVAVFPAQEDADASLNLVNAAPYILCVDCLLSNFEAVTAKCFHCVSSGKKSKSVFDFLTYSRETWFSLSYEKVLELDWVNFV